MSHRVYDEALARETKDAQRHLLALGIQLEHQTPHLEDPLHLPVTQIVRAHADMVNKLDGLCSAVERTHQKLAQAYVELDAAHGRVFALENQNNQLQKDLQALNVIMRNIAAGRADQVEKS